MTRTLLLGALLLSSGCATTTTKKTPAKAAAKAPRAPVPLAEYFKIRRVGRSSFSFDERLVAYSSDAGGRVDIWVQPVGGGAARQITRVAGFIHSFAFSPTRDQLLFEADRGGDELPHIYLTDSKGTAPKDLMAGDPRGARTDFVRWADDGKTFLYLSNRRDRRYLDLCEYTIAGGASRVLWRSSGRLSFALASRDHRRFIITETLSDVNANLYLLRRGAKKPELLTPHKGDVLYEPKDFSPDGKRLFFTADDRGEFTALYELRLADRQRKLVLGGSWDVEGGSFSRGGRYFGTITNVDGTPQVALKEVASGRLVKMPRVSEHGTLVPADSSPKDRYVGAFLLTDTTPRTQYIVDLARGTARKLVDVLPPSLRDRAFVAGRSVRIPSFDKWKVPAFLYRPAGKGPFPAVIDVHGGPTWQSRRRFKGMRQYLVSKGYAVLVPNVRGSTGYGKSYTALDNMDLGGGPLKDIVACKRWLVKQADVDPARVVVMGGSYGGYMALAAATFTPTEFAANVDFFGVSDLKSLVESFPPYWAAFATFIHKKFGDPKNPAHAKYQHDRSPGNFVHRIQRPLLVVQGANDARVKQDQSDRIVKALRKRAVPVHYLVIPGEGHGFSKNANRLLAYQATDRFLDRYIFGDKSVAVLPKSVRGSQQGKR